MDKERQKKFEQKIKEGTHDYSREKEYIYPEDPVVRENLEWFQDQQTVKGINTADQHGCHKQIIQKIKKFEFLFLFFHYLFSTFPYESQGLEN